MISYDGPSFGRAGVPSTREPEGLFRTDARTPDSATLVPWSAENIRRGMLRWFTHAPHPTSLHRRCLSANRKALKYAGLLATHFPAVALKTLDPSVCEFINEIGSRMTGGNISLSMPLNGHLTNQSCRYPWHFPFSN